MQRIFSMVKKGSIPLLKKSSDDAYQGEFTLETQHSLDDIWGALVKPDKLAQWLLPVSGKLSKGGTYSLGTVAQGQITVCEPKRRLALTFVRQDMTQTLDITFSEVGKGKSKERVLRVKFTANISDLPDGVWATYGPSVMGIGWEMVGAALLAYLDAPKEPRGADYIAKYAASAEGGAYVSQAFEGWRAAAQAGGVTISSTHVPRLLEFYSGLHR